MELLLAAILIILILILVILAISVHSIETGRSGGVIDEVTFTLKEIKSHIANLQSAVEEMQVDVRSIESNIGKVDQGVRSIRGDDQEEGNLTNIHDAVLHVSFAINSLKEDLSHLGPSKD